jgi:hypothetical protein
VTPDRALLLAAAAGLALLGLGAVGLALLRPPAWRPADAPRPPPPRPGTTPCGTHLAAPLRADRTYPGLAPALVQLLAEVDAAWPGRNRATDGGAPSAAHRCANPGSDHDAGDAYDFTADQVAGRGPDPGALAELARIDPRTKYVIWDRRIAAKDRDGNAWRPYERSRVQTDPHTSHVHVSVRRESRGDARPWGVDALLRREAVA